MQCDIHPWYTHPSPCRCPIIPSGPCDLTSDLTHLGVHSLQHDLWLWCVCHFQAPVKLITLAGHSSSWLHRTAGEKNASHAHISRQVKAFSCYIKMFCKSNWERNKVSAHATKIQTFLIQKDKWSRIMRYFEVLSHRLFSANRRWQSIHTAEPNQGSFPY